MPLYALCPFFLYEKKTMFACESGKMRFPSYERKKRCMETLCCSWQYEECKHYKQKMKEYED